jgi:hypothetical protein
MSSRAVIAIVVCQVCHGTIGVNFFADLSLGGCPQQQIIKGAGTAREADTCWLRIAGSPIRASYRTTLELLLPDSPELLLPSSPELLLLSSWPPLPDLLSDSPLEVGGFERF